MTTIVQWNCRGLLPRLAELQLLISRYNPSVICLQETHLKTENKFLPRHFAIYRTDVESQTAKGGTAILIRRELIASEINLSTDLQATAIILKTPLRITICNIYLPKPNWTEESLNNLIDQLPLPVLLLGDFNAHNPLWGSIKTNNAGRKIERIFNQHNMVLLNSGQNTHFVSRNGSFSAIDLTFCSPSIATLFRWNPSDDLYGSDHFPILITNQNAVLKEDKPQRWIIERADWRLYKKSMSTNIPDEDDVELTTTRFTNAIIDAAHKSIPRTKGLNPNKKRVPWWSNDVAQAIRNKKRALRKFKKDSTLENLIEFKKQRATTRKIIVNAKKTSWEKYVSTITNQTTPNIVWEKIRQISGAKKHYQSPCIQANDSVITDPTIVADHLAEYFQSVSNTKNYSDEFITIKDTAEKDLDFTTEETLPYNEHLTMDELNNALRTMKNTAPGPDEITAPMLQNLSRKAKSDLLKVYNKIWVEGTYPSQWRTATIIPILKPNKDKGQASSYRPIALTCCLSKLFEKMINNRLMWELEAKNLLSPIQSGFRKNRSTLDQLVYLDNIIQKAFELKQHAIAIFFDLEKAYDTTWRYLVLKQLYDWGFRGHLPIIIESFLKLRKIQVRIGNTISRAVVQENGIPQGSTISVSLFIIALNGITQNIKNPVEACLYVDDLVLVRRGSCIGLIKKDLQDAVNQVVTYTEHNGFRMSVLKTRWMHFHRKIIPDFKPVIKMKDTRIEEADTIRFLGLTLDKKLTWNNHIKDIITKSKIKMNILKCLSNINWGSDREVLLQIYKTMILSQIDYGSIAYASANKTTLRKLDAIHHQGLRLVTGAHRTSPIDSIIGDTLVYRLNTRRRVQSLKYAANIWAMPHHRNYDMIYRGLTDSNNAEERDSKSLVGRINKIFITEHMKFDDVYERFYNENPPWSLPKANINTELAKYNKDTTSSIIYKAEINKILDLHRDADHIYTDGSVCERRVGCAFFTENTIDKWRLPDNSTIYTAELTAIIKALDLINAKSNKKTLICTDSLSSLLSIEDNYSTDPMIQQIHKLRLNIENKERSIIFIWTPGHCGIYGNEKADKLANEARMQNAIKERRIRIEDVILKIKGKAKDQWQDEWSKNTTQFQKIKPLLEVWRMPAKIKRRETVCITRLRIGHTNLTHNYILTRTEQPKCESCNTPLTVKHILQDCAKNETIRQDVKLPRNINDMLGRKSENILKTIEFCKRLKIIDKI